jgi:hypothetical protein
MATYSELSNIQPELTECFFAFSKKQFEEGIVNNNLVGKKLFDGGGGLIGTKEGIEKLMADYDAIAERITKECEPQEVYKYEFNNYECSYTNDDREAIKTVISYFGVEKAREVKRRFGYISIEKLVEEMEKS